MNQSTSGDTRREDPGGLRVPHGRGDEGALLDWARDHLAAYKLPRKVAFVDHLPRTKNGKLRRRELPRRLDEIGDADP